MLSMTEDLVRLGRCQSLLVLTLYDTPLALSLNYRHQVVNRFANVVVTHATYMKQSYHVDSQSVSRCG